MEKIPQRRTLQFIIFSKYCYGFHSKQDDMEGMKYIWGRWDMQSKITAWDQEGKKPLANTKP
jgi:hypothetical protein